MPELDVLEAKVPVRLAQSTDMAAQPIGRHFASFAGVLATRVCSRARDIFEANWAELLERVEDPATLIRMTIVEMEERLVELRAAAARSIAGSKEIRRAVSRLEALRSDWTGKAELALAKGRDDLAKAALIERQRADELAGGLRTELSDIDAVLREYESDTARLESKLREARARQHAIAARVERAVTRARAREILHGGRTQEAFARFELLERRAEFAEGRCEALGITQLDDQIDQLKASQELEAELRRMKDAVKARAN